MIGILENMKDFKKVRNWSQALLFFFSYFILGVVLYYIAFFIALAIQPDLLTNLTATGALSGLGGTALLIFLWAVILGGALQITNAISKEKDIKFFEGNAKIVLIIVYVLVALFFSPVIMAFILLVMGSYMTTLPLKSKLLV